MKLFKSLAIKEYLYYTSTGEDWFAIAGLGILHNDIDLKEAKEDILLWL